MGALPLSSAVRKLGDKSAESFAWFFAYTPIVIPVLSDVPHPRQGLIAALFHNFQIANLDPGHREIWNFEFNGDWSSFLYVLF